MTGRVRAIVLDFDGVLLESEAAKAAVFDEIFLDYPEHQLAMSAFNREHYSLPRRAKFEHCVFTIMNRPNDEAAVAAMVERFSARVVRRVAACAEVPGASEFLHEFAREIPLYVSSVTPEAELREVIARRGWTSHFVEVFGDPPTPKPTAIRSILEREAAAPSEVVFVGDSAGDARAAAATGVRFIARGSGHGFDGLTLTACRDLHEVAAILRSGVGTR